MLINCSDSTLRSKSASLKFYYTIRDDGSRGPYHHSFFESRSDVQTDTDNLHSIYTQAALVASFMHLNINISAVCTIFFSI